MTTIVWDGNELVADSQSTLVEWSISSDQTTKRRIVDVKTTTKIFMPKNAVFKGLKVYAIAASGSDQVLKSLKERTEGLPAIDLGLSHTFASYFGGQKTFSLMLVLADMVATVECLDDRLQVTVYDRNTQGRLIFLGSGSPWVRQACGYASGREAVSLASYFDAYTGGHLNTWKNSDIAVGTVPCENKYKSLAIVALRKARHWVVEKCTQPFLS